MILSIKPKSVAIALFIYLTLYIGWVAVAIFLQSRNGALSLAVLTVFPALIAGYVAAWLAGTKGTLHGAVVGAVIFPFLCADSLVRVHANPFVNGHWCIYLIFGTLFSALGGLVWDIKKVRPIGIACFTFLLLYIALKVVTGILSPFRINSDTFVVINVLAFFPPLIAGYVAASLAKGRSVLHGALLAVLIALFLVADCRVTIPGDIHVCGVADWLVDLIWAVVFVGLGSLLWEVVETMNKRRLNPTEVER